MYRDAVSFFTKYSLQQFTTWLNLLLDLNRDIGQFNNLPLSQCMYYVEINWTWTPTVSIRFERKRGKQIKKTPKKLKMQHSIEKIVISRHAWIHFSFYQKIQKIISYELSGAYQAQIIVITFSTWSEYV